MTTSTRAVEFRVRSHAWPFARERDSWLRARTAGFTLSEVLIASTLSLLVLAGVLTAFLFLGRTGLAAGQYQAMETELRQGLELFSDDVRRATAIRWTSSWQIALDVPASDGATLAITYLFEPAGPTALTGRFYRVDSAGKRRPLVNDVSRDFTFKRYRIDNSGGGETPAANDLETKQLQISLRTLRDAPGGPALTQAAISARYVLRNKTVSR